MRFLTCLCAALFASAPATATVFDWAFSGEVWPDVAPSLYPLAAGTQFTGTLHIDTGAASHAGGLPWDHDPYLFDATEFDPGSASITMDLGGRHITESAHLVLLDSRNPGTADEVRVEFDTYSRDTPNLTFRFYDFDDTTVQSGTLANRLALGSLTFADIRFEGYMELPPPDYTPWIYQFTGGITALTPVPEAASWAMMVAGFGLVGGALRNRRALAAA